MPRLKATHFLLTLATLSAPVLLAQNAVSARPGTINYIEGQASLEGQQLTPKSVGHSEMGVGQYLATATGKAEVLLTPGIFLRLDNNSTAKMVTPDLTHTEVQLTQGRATVEVDQIYKQNDILIDVGQGQAQLLKNGLYEFDAASNTLRVFKGEAAAFETLTPQSNEKATKVKEGKQLMLTGETAKSAGFDRNQAEDSDALYKWSSLRSGYLGEANLNLARSYAEDPGYGYGGGYASGWLWSPSIYSYTWLPGAGFYGSPFGYNFYSPYFLYGGGFGGYGYGGYGYRGYGGRGFRGPIGTSVGVHSTGVAGGGFHGSTGGGGGFHGGGGGHR